MRVSLSALFVVIGFFIASTVAVLFALGPQSWWQEGVVALIAICLFGIIATLVKDRLIVALSIAAPFLASIIWIGTPSWTWLVLGASFLLIWWGYWIAKREQVVLP